MINTHVKRVVGVDYGTKRVGIAVADPLLLFAQPSGTFTPESAIQALRELNAEEGLATIVIGWPLEEDGTQGPGTARVQQYVNRLENALPDVEVVKWDERYSSEAAREAIAQAGGRHALRKDKSVVDRVAAAVILQEYLDNRS